MDEMTLTAEDELQLKDAIADAPESIRDGFCKCWPNVKALLQWVHDHVKSGILKWVVKAGIALGDRLFKLLDCKTASARA